MRKVILKISCLAAAFGLTVASAPYAAYAAQEEIAARDGLVTALESEEQEAADEGREYDGYVFGLKDSGTQGDISSDSTSSIEGIEYSDGCYMADSTDDIFDAFSATQIEYIEPDYYVYLDDYGNEGATDLSGQEGTVGAASATEPDDPLYSAQWHLGLMNVSGAWGLGLEGNSYCGRDKVVIGVVDSGINAGHEDLDSSHIVEGKSFLANYTTTDDILGHGTNTAGLILASKDNGKGIAGLVPQAYIMPLRVFSTDKSAKMSTVANAIYYAVQNDVDVLNLSFGTTSKSTLLANACTSAVNAGIIVCASAGNNMSDTLVYPACYDYVVGVGSVGTSSDHSAISTFSNTGDSVFVTAPGYNVRSLSYSSNNGYTTASGTSFSCPAVAALAAVAKGINSTITPSQFMNVLKSTSTDLGQEGRDDEYGWGLIDFAAASAALIDGYSSEVLNAETLIGEITTPTSYTAEFETAVTSARAAYDAVFETFRTFVSNYSTLVSYEELLEKLKAAHSEAEVVEALIDAIGEVSYGSFDAIQAARTAYDGLEEDEKALVTNYAVLVAAEEAYAKLDPVGGFVWRLYKLCLGRAPGDEGFANHVNNLKSGGSGGQTAWEFIFSQEFKSKNLCNEDFVKLLYEAVMGREAEDAGLAAWVNVLEDGTKREEVFNGFSQSVEFSNICQDYGINAGGPSQVPEYGTVPSGNCAICGKEAPVTTFVKRLYTTCLVREADDTGLSDWTGLLLDHKIGGSACADGFFKSDEYAERQRTNYQFVTDCYETYLGRQYDSEGMLYWLSALSSGQSRDSVRDGFAQSTEFAIICKKYGISV